MLNTIIGYPRIGGKRELKFALEKYFKHEIPAEELKSVAAQIRKQHYGYFAEQNIDLVPCGDFSFYDNLLDTALQFGIIPERYVKSGLNDLDTYFAMARGVQTDSVDLKALPMKKWFNTNYHYIEPEFDGKNVVKFNPVFLSGLIDEANELKLNYKVAQTGPFTLLKLVKYVAGTSVNDLRDALVSEYVEFLDFCRSKNASFVSFAEPSLVKDLTAEDKQLFVEIYRKLLSVKGNLKIGLDTYFGDIRDIYNEVTSLGFDAISLDFREGRKTFDLIRANGFPKDTVLVAGLINGKNIWRSNYDTVIKALDELKSLGINCALGCSCSLLHVPESTEFETKLSAKILSYLSFARQKLAELNEIKAIVNGDSGADKFLADNRALFSVKRVENDAALDAKIASLTEADFTRLPERTERLSIQHDVLGLPLFPTTTIGSFPQTAQIRALRRDFKNGAITRQAYEDGIAALTVDCLRLQEELGLDVLVHGEFERNDMVEYFGEKLDGYIFTQNGWVQSYGSRCVKPPVIWGNVTRKEAMTVKMSAFANSKSDKDVKGMLTGPVTIFNWSFPREDLPVKTSIQQLALALRDEVLDLEKAGIRIIQIDEAALKEKLPLRRSDWESEYLDFAIPAFRLVHSGVKPETQIHTHMCYSEFNEIIPWIDAMDADVITFEASRSDFAVLDALKANNFKTEVGPGVYDIHSPRVPSVDEIVNALKLIVSREDYHKVWVNPDCGLKTRGNEETKKSLQNLVEAAKILRSQYN
jgi:5-methyltetrahydropteroyltriglutamate--homocysteine methyltransferase